MTFLDYLLEFILCFGAVFTFCGLINAPKNTVICSSAIGGAAYVVYRLISVNSEKEILAYFVASIVISVASEICARLYKRPSTVFIFPGIIPLVPGVGLYNSMLCLVQNNHDMFIVKAVETVFIAGAIAIAVAIVHITARSIFPRKNGIIPLHNLLKMMKDKDADKQ